MVYGGNSRQPDNISEDKKMDGWMDVKRKNKKTTLIYKEFDVILPVINTNIIS